MSRRLLVSCGEASGDLYAGALVRALRALAPDIEISGLGGAQFTAAGGRLLADFRGLAVTGFTELVAKVPVLRSVKQRLVEFAARERPDALVVIDYFGFNARLARDIKRLGIPVVYYVSPQIWAWRSGRIKTIREIADRVLVIFPFEQAIYEQAGVPVEFVGHPLIDIAQAVTPRRELLERLRLVDGKPTVAILPGSRTSELRRILPTLVEAVRLLRARLPDTQVLVARAPNLDDALFAPLTGVRGAATVTGATDDVLAAADLALTASGTATVQCALHGTPMVVVYRVSSLEYRVVRPFVKLDTFAMVNLIAGRRIVPELIQDAFTAEAVAAEGVSLLNDRARAETMRADLADVRHKLGAPGASRRAAEAILAVMSRSCATA